MIHGEEFIGRGRHKVRLTVSAPIGETPYKPKKVIDERNLETCLNCTMPDCKGSCSKIRRTRNAKSNKR